jgi:hypothetical protein
VRIALTITRCFGVVGEPGNVVLGQTRGFQLVEHGPMKEEPLVGRNGLEDDQPRQLMAEDEQVSLRPQHPAVETLVDGAGLGPGDGSQQPGLDARTDDGSRVEDGLPRQGEAGGPGQDGIADSGRHFVLPGGEHLGDIERVAARLLVQGPGVEGATGNELADTFDCQWRERKAAKRCGEMSRGIS